MPAGYMGKFLNIDLSEKMVEKELLEEKTCHDLLGGYGIGVRILFDRQKPGVEPLGPDNTLGFITGPLTGTPALFGSRYTTVGKSPLTGMWGDANSGGDFGPNLKFSGYDAVFVTGVSDNPVYLLIDDGMAELKDAGHLWGKDCDETEDIIQRDIGKDTRVACIGGSGERLSLISAIINNKGRAAARAGLGAVMGSKKLKAIAVRGKQVVPIKDEAKAKELRREYLGGLSGGLYDSLKDFGTCGSMAAQVRVGDAPVKNWGGVGVVDFPEAGPISDHAVTALEHKKYGCWRCPIACGGIMKAGRKYQYKAGVHKPEYETLASFGSLCLNNDIRSIIKINDICNRYGLDTISAGATIAFAIECYENGIIGKSDTDGIELTWGNAPAIVAITEKMARREGFGDILADGVKLAAERIGHSADRFAIHVHGQEPGMHDPKKYPHYGTSCKTDAAPGRHTPGTEGTIRSVSGMKIPAFDWKGYSGRGEAHKMGADWLHAINTSGVCMLGYMSLPSQALPDFLNAITGWELDMYAVLAIGERIANLRQAFNIREGLAPATFEIPGRLIGEPPQTAGPLQGKTVDIQTMVRDYYDARNWGQGTGRPSRKKLKELGLNDVAMSIHE
ncbi:aldehyde ferredoxin oxidoreductase family protein [Chloroflexota bacterium]